MFIDELEISLKAGNGGDGRASFYPGKKSGPDGGKGGDGADLYIQASPHMTNLNQYLGKSIIEAESGKPGGSNKKSGLNGIDSTADFPIGTLLIDTDTQEEIELTDPDVKILICKGGYGGKGNDQLKSASNTTPKVAEKGRPGQQKNFKILVRMIADFGLIGFPNAGKSSLLNELTNAKAVVADYPFTTLQPNLGALNGPPATPSLHGGRGKVVADIPGLIEGASGGKGLGVNFLKHIEKVKLLIHCISSESADVVADYHTVVDELEAYNPQLADKHQIILLTKSDLITDKEVTKKIKLLKKLQKIVLAVSIHNWESLQALSTCLLNA